MVARDKNPETLARPMEKKTKECDVILTSLKDEVGDAVQNT